MTGSDNTAGAYESATAATAGFHPKTCTINMLQEEEFEDRLGSALWLYGLCGLTLETTHHC